MKFTRELEKELKEIKLSELEAGGVDNWDWYGDSIEDYINSIDGIDEDEDYRPGRAATLDALEAGGVDNWDGYGDSLIHYDNYRDYLEGLPEGSEYLGFVEFQETNIYKKYLDELCDWDHFLFSDWERCQEDEDIPKVEETPEVKESEFEMNRNATICSMLAEWYPDEDIDKLKSIVCHEDMFSFNSPFKKEMQQAISKTAKMMKDVGGTIDEFQMAGSISFIKSLYQSGKLTKYIKEHL